MPTYRPSRGEGDNSISNDPMFESIRKYQAVANGELKAWVWYSERPDFAGVAIQVRFSDELEADCGEGDHGFSDWFAKELKLRFGGQLSPEQADEQITRMVEARFKSQQSEGLRVHTPVHQPIASALGETVFSNPHLNASQLEAADRWTGEPNA